MYENTPAAELQWVTAVPGHVPDQAVIYEKRSSNDIMYVVAVVDGSSRTPGLYETGKTCAEYEKYQHGAQCLSTFQYLILKRREYAPSLDTTMVCWRAFHQDACYKVSSYASEITYS